VEDILKTAFRTRYGHYEFQVVSFEIINTPVVFMDLINMVFSQYLDQFVVIFIDDILVYSKNEFAEHLRIMLQTLWHEQLYVKLSKCEFWLNSISFLVHLVSGKDILVDPSKVQAVGDWSVLKSAKDIKIFIGLAWYYCCFIQDFFKIATLLAKLTRKWVKYEWTEECKKAFEELKIQLITALILKMSTGSGDMIIYSDAPK